MEAVQHVKLYYIKDAVVNMREYPRNNSSVVSQALFSEKINVKNTEENWVQVITPDGYSGWIPKESMVEREEAYQTSLKVSRLSAHIYGIQDTEFGPIKTLPYGSKLQMLDATNSRWIKIALPDGTECYIQKGDVAEEEELKSKNDIAVFS